MLQQLFCFFIVWLLMLLQRRSIVLFGQNVFEGINGAGVGRRALPEASECLFTVTLLEYSIWVFCLSLFSNKMVALHQRSDSCLDWCGEFDYCKQERKSSERSNRVLLFKHISYLAKAKHKKSQNPFRPMHFSSSCQRVFFPFPARDRVAHLKTPLY